MLRASAVHAHAGEAAVKHKHAGGKLGVPLMHCRLVLQLAGALLLSKVLSAVHKHVQLHNNRHLDVCTANGRGRAEQ